MDSLTSWYSRDEKDALTGILLSIDNVNEYGLDTSFP